MTAVGEICLDGRKEMLDSLTECKKASKELAKDFYDYGTYENYPKGCSLYQHNYVFWNLHETGQSNGQSQSICKIGKSHFHIYSI